MKISFIRSIDQSINENFDCDVYVTTHFEKSTHFDKKIQSASNVEPNEHTLNFFQSTLNLGPTQPTLKTIFKDYKDSLFTQNDRITKLEH